MASLPQNATQDQIEEELDFTDVLITSLDEGADDYAERLEALETIKFDLEQRLEAIFQGGSEQTAVQDQTQGEAANMDSHSERPDWWSFLPAEDRTDSDSVPNNFNSNTFNSYDGSFDTFPSGMKRPLPDSLRADSQHVSKRPTPELSRVGTPVSFSDFTGMNGSNNADPNPRANVRQRMIEADLQRKRDREMADKELALDLDKQRAQPHMNGFASSSQPRSTFQTTLGFDGSYQRPPPPKPKVESPERPAFPRASNSYSYGSQTYPNGQPSSLGAFGKMARQPYGQPAPNPFIKPEPGLIKREQPSYPSLSTEVVDLTASDDEDEELAVVSSNSFTPNHRSQRPNLNNPLPVRTLQPPAPAYPSIPGSFPITPQTCPQNSHYTLPPMQQMASRNGYQSVYGNANGVPLQIQNQPQGMNGLLNGAMTGASNLARNLLTPVTNLLNPLPSWDRESGDDDLLFVGSQQRPPGSMPFAGYADRDLYNRRYNEIADYNPEKTKEEINALLENIRPDEDIPADLRVKTPEAMTIKLHKYQELGLTWLKSSEQGKNKGGILGDEMGLGKTIQMLSLIVEHKSEDPRCKTTLIVAPVALMRQWKQEIEQKIKPGRHRLNVFIHHQTAKKKTFQELRGLDIVLTTYGTLSSEYRKLEKYHLRKHNNPAAVPLSNERCAIIGEDAAWYRVVLDEAQCIKNKSTLAHRAACLINAKYRFCMTGTPMMNNVEEFYSLVKFLRIRPYSSWEKFKVDINSPLKMHNEDSREAAMVKLQALCKAIMLRRTKKSTFEGKPILVLPERTTDVENPVFDDDEREFYNAIEQKQRLQFNKYLKAGQVGNHYSAILVLLLRLRQAACHPHLIRDFGIAAAADITQEEVINFAETLEPQVVERIKATGGNFECPVCYDAVANPAIFIPCGHDTCRECFTRITDPSDQLRNGNENGGGARCPNCRGPIDTKKVTDFDAFKKVHMPELLTEEEQKELEAIKKEEGEEDDNDDDDDSDTDSDDDDSEDEKDDVDANGNLKDFIVNDDEDPEAADDSDVDDEEPPVKKEEADEEAGIAAPPKKRGRPKGSKSKSTKGKAKASGEQPAFKLPRKKKPKKPKKRNAAVTLAELAKLSQRNMKARKTYLRRLRDNYQDSAKIRKTMELLQEIMDDAEGEKVLIFSQWTSLLDLLEIPVDGKGWGYRRYDGSMNAKQRGDAVDDFRDHTKNIRMMLVSLKAGNAGLNLNMASRVIILDPFWNPYIEEQAIDRAHRIGQERPVKVHRILVAETVEDRIIELQEKKRALISEALDEKAGQRIGRLGVQELAYLFGVTRNANERVNYVPATRN